MKLFQRISLLVQVKLVASPLELKVHVIRWSGNFQAVIVFNILAPVPFKIFTPPHHTMEQSKVVAFVPPALGKLQHCLSYFLQILFLLSTHSNSLTPSSVQLELLACSIAPFPSVSSGDAEVFLQAFTFVVHSKIMKKFRLIDNPLWRQLHLFYVPLKMLVL